MSESRITTKDELLAQIDRNWKALHTALDGLTEAQVTTIRDAQGWTVKDHIIHLTAWERSAVCFLQRKPRHDGLGVDETTFLKGDDDQTNAVIYKQRKNQTLAETLAQFRDVHHQLLELLKPLTDADLQQPYRHYLPDEPGEGDGPPALRVISGNSAQHYAEHQSWIVTLVKS